MKDHIAPFHQFIYQRFIEDGANDKMNARMTVEMRDIFIAASREIIEQGPFIIELEQLLSQLNKS